jgi:two-component system, chemotaxis family, chemotaxis protein CheY
MPMKSLIVEDNFTSRLLIQKILSRFGECHMAVNGSEAVAAFADALHSNEPYTLVCLDIIMPEMDGHQALKEIRTIEGDNGILVGDGVKIIMTTVLGDMNTKIAALNASCDAYMVKPLDGNKMLEILRSFRLIK